MRLKKQENLKSAILINAISKYSKVVINLLFTAVLARILTPEDYGIVAIVTVFTTFFSLFSDMGLGTAVIQNKALHDKEIDEIYSFTIILGIILTVLFCLFSYPLSLFYNDNVYVPIAFLLSISLFFNTLNMIPNALLMKDKQFMLVGLRTIIITIIGSIICVIMAYSGMKYYSIVFHSIVTSILTYVLNRRSVYLRFTRHIHKATLNKVSSYSLFQLAFNFVNYFSRNMDNILTGKFMGNAQLGYYDKSYKLMQYPSSNLTHVITPALHPILSDYQNDKEYIFKKYMIIVKMLMLAGIYIAGFCFLASKEIINIMYGPNWDKSIACFCGLSISIWAQMTSSSTGAIFQSLGKTKDMFIVGAINAIINVVAIIAGVATKDIVILSYYVGSSYCIHFFTAYFFLIRKSFGFRFSCFIGQLWKEIIIGLIILVSIKMYPFQVSNLFASFFVKLMYLLFFFLLSLLVFREYRILLKKK